MPKRESSRTSSRVRVCALLLLAGLWGAVARAQVGSAVCGTTYVMQNANPTQLFEVDTSMNPWDFNLIGNAPSNVTYNAMAYRVDTDTLYAMRAQPTPSNVLLQIDANDGSVTGLGQVVGLPGDIGAYHAGEFGDDGFMYVRNTGDTGNLYRIDVDATPPTAEAVPLSQPGTFADMTRIGGLLYAVNGDDLVSIDVGGMNAMVTVIGPTGLSISSFGGAYSASNGVFVLDNGGTGAYQLDPDTGAGVKVSDAPGTSNHDGARCATAPLELEADIAVTKTDDSDTYLPGEDVVYTIVVTNNGPMGAQNVLVNDPLPDGITAASWTCEGMGGGVCEAQSGDGEILDIPDLPPLGSVTYTFTVSVPGDFTGELVNTVTVEPPDGYIDGDPSNNDATDVNQSELEPGITLEKAGSGPEPLEVGSTIEYEFLVTNVGNVPLTDVTLTDPLPGMSPIDCPQDTLEPKAEMTCTATYTVTQEDVDAGVIENTATVTGQPPGTQPLVQDEASAVFPPEQGPGISMEKSGSGPDPLTVGATITYEFLVTNTGNVTLTEVTVTDPLPGLSPIDCPETTLAPGAEMTCTATYEVTEADVEAGVVENTATATGETPTGGPPPTDESTATVPPTPPVPSLPPLAFVLLVALLATATLWTLRRARV